MTSTYRSVAEQSEAERGGERSILSRQSADHRDLNDLMQAHEAATDPARLAELLAGLAERALRHAFAEETVLFPAYRQYLPDSADVVSAHIENEHQAVNDSLQRLQDIDPRDPVYADLVSSTFQLIRDDARNEEDVLLPQLQQVLETFDKWHKRGDAGHVIFGGFDGDANAYKLLADGYLDACGVQNLFLEVDMAFQAFADMWAGKKPEKLLLDPGFVITQANLQEKRDEMWGYVVYKKENPKG